MSDREHSFLLQKFETFERDVISPAVFSGQTPLGVEWCPVDRDLRPSEAHSLAFAPVEPDFRWGPAWARGWFRLRGWMKDAPTKVVRFDCGTEALLFDADAPWHGFDANRNWSPLPPNAASDDAIELYIEAECMHPWGVRAFQWDTSETHRRWESAHPGHLTLAELAQFDADVWRLESAFRFARELLAEVGLRTATGRLLRQSLERCARLIDDQDVASTAGAARAELDTVFRAGAHAGASRVAAVGHAHIDTAWLWTLDHTRRKCQRSWSNMLRLMERFDDVSFVCSQAAQYAMVETDAPTMFREIAARVAEGRWEPFGSMWVEPDCNIPSGESLIRQIAHGCHYWSGRFGDGAGHGVCYLPDTFGFPATLPTIFSVCGVHTFIANKLSWNQSNAMPHTSFEWVGPDGSRVLSHLTPGGDYNATNSPAELIKGERVGLAAPPADCWLQPFGFGDGGGGPTDRQIENARLAGDCPSLPRMLLSSASSFVSDLHREHEQAGERGEPWPAWRGDLYLELHRGTFTTQRRLKQLNFAAEEALREAEMFSSLFCKNHGKQLHVLWSDVLTNQFHDILPGSSITEVNEQAGRELSGVVVQAGKLAERNLETEDGSPRVWNPSSGPATGVIDAGGDLVLVRNVPPAAMSVVTPHDPTAPVRVTPSRLENGVISAEFDDAGEIRSLRRAGGAELAASPMHRYRLFRDRPHMWDAWEIDPCYERDEIARESTTSVTVSGDDPMRCSIELRSTIGAASSIATRYVLDADSPVLRVEIDIDWHESHRLLRVEYPTRVLSPTAIAGTQFGTCERPTHRNTSWEQARFEFPAHRFVSLGSPGLGLAVLAPDVYGWSAESGTIGASLLRSPEHPDPEADRGSHRFIFGLYPHGGDWRRENVTRVAEQFARPLRCLASCEPPRPLRWEVVGEACVELSAMYPCPEHEASVVVRFVEVCGGAGGLRLRSPRAIRAITPLDGLGRSADQPQEPAETLPIGPGSITTLRITFDA
ncbi:MAG: glycoside hydrolase family 38 C-terminal domain-containing protein [Planctomycetota bacterium]